MSAAVIRRQKMMSCQLTHFLLRSKSITFSPVDSLLQVQRAGGRVRCAAERSTGLGDRHRWPLTTTSFSSCCPSWPSSSWRRVQSSSSCWKRPSSCAASWRPDRGSSRRVGSPTLAASRLHTKPPQFRDKLPDMRTIWGHYYSEDHFYGTRTLKVKLIVNWRVQ